METVAREEVEEVHVVAHHEEEAGNKRQRKKITDVIDEGFGNATSWYMSVFLPLTRNF
jgi:hypothetical protein